MNALRDATAGGDGEYPQCSLALEGLCESLHTSSRKPPDEEDAFRPIGFLIGQPWRLYGDPSQVAFFATTGLIAVAVSFPLIAMYAAGEFVGQRLPPGWLQMVVIGLVGAGLVATVMMTGFALKAGKDGMTAKDWVILAWVAGSALTAHLGLLNWIHAKTRERRACEPE